MTENPTLLTYPGATDERQVLDLWAPSEGVAEGAIARARRRTGVVLVHGGGWYGGTRDAFTNLARWAAGRGHAVAQVGYRIDDDTDYRAKLADVITGVEVFAARVPEVERIVLAGSSAGAHLATALVLEQRAPLPVAGALSINGPGSMADEHLGEDGRKRGVQLGLTDAHRALFTDPPADLAPAHWLFHLAEDEHYFLHPGVRVLADALTSRGHDVDTAVEPDTKHGFVYSRTPDSHPETFALLGRFFDRVDRD